MKISLDKKYKTRDGKEVRLYTVDGFKKYPVHGAIKSDGEWFLEAWTSEGKYCSSEEDSYDLIEVKEKRKLYAWVHRLNHKVEFLSVNNNDWFVPESDRAPEYDIEFGDD